MDLQEGAKRTTINGESNTFYYHNDHLGSTRLVTDSNKNIVTAVMYQPFGESYSVEGDEDYLFCGKEKNATGLYYYGARHYDPDLGRFLTRDPYIGKLVKPQSLNQYTYCYNNPLLFVDPDGRDPLHYEGPIYYDEEDKALYYSHAPQLIVYFTPQEGYEWFVAFCIVAGAILAIAAAPHILAALWEYLVALGNVLISAGSKVAWAVIRVLDKLTERYIAAAGTRHGQMIIDIILAAIAYIIREIKVGNEDIDSIELYDDKGNYIGSNIISKKLGDFPIKGKVIFSSGEEYEWKWSGGTYYVRIDGEWVPITKSGWKPGHELPDELSGDEVPT